MKIYKLVLCFLFVTVSYLQASISVTSVNPTNGPIAGGNLVTINGSGFTGTTAVKFGTRPATSFIVLNDTTITATVPIGTVGTVDVTVASASEISSISRDDFYTYTTVGWNGITSSTNPNDVALFNTSSNTFTATINTSAISLTSVIHPNGTFIYTANDAPPSVSIIDAATNTVVGSIPTSVGPGAFDMIINPAGTRLYISNITSGFVTVVDTTTNTIVTDIFVLPNLGPISITPDGSTVYVSNFSGGVFPINTATNNVLPVIPTGFFPGKMSITPNGKKAFVPIFSSNNILVFDLPSQTLTNNISVLPSLGPYGTSILPNSTTLFVANITSNSVTEINIATESVTTTYSLVPPLPPNAGLFWLASTPDSKSVYVINEIFDLVVPIDVVNHTVGAPFGGIGGVFVDLVISPDPAPVAAFTATSTVFGKPTLFDASASLSPIGTIVSYRWDFGDGNVVTTLIPTTSHLYTVPGSYTVTLTVTNSAGTSTTQVFSSGFMSNNGGPTATRSRIITALVPPPRNLKGFQKHCRFPSQTDIVNILQWSAPEDFDPVEYRIFKDAALTKLLGVVSPNKRPLEFLQHNRRKDKIYTYYVVSVSASGFQSEPAIVKIKCTKL